MKEEEDVKQEPDQESAIRKELEEMLEMRARLKALELKFNALLSVLESSNVLVREDFEEAKQLLEQELHDKVEEGFE